MSGETFDLSGEQEPEERLEHLQQNRSDGVETDHKEPAHDGSVQTEDFDVSDAINRLDRDEGGDDE